MHISYTKQAENAIKYAEKKAAEMHHPYIGTVNMPGWQGRSLRGTAWRKRRSAGLWMN